MNYTYLQKKMLDEHLRKRGIKDEKILNAMEKIPRHLFVEEALRYSAYKDHPLPIGENQTISQPYMVALMIQSMELEGNEKVLEIGAGSGYQTAILCELCDKVYSIERFPSLASKARKMVESLGYLNVVLKIFDGTYGWPDEAPFDRIIASAYGPAVPDTFINQLNDNGIAVLPVGDKSGQTLVRIKKCNDVIIKDNITNCTFVKLVGKYGFND